MAQDFYDILGNLKVTGKYLEPRPSHLHKGIDVALPLGSPIRASIGGTVKGIYNDPKGYGNYMDIVNPETGITTRYAHAQGFDVPVGTNILSGQTIGKSGATGRATGPHLHYEVLRNGKTINPMELKNIMANLPTNDLAKVKTDIISQQMGNALPQEKDEKQQLFDELVKNEIKNLMQPRQYQPTQLGDVIPAFQTGAAAGIGKLGEYLGTSQGQNVLGSLFGAFGNKDMALAMARGAQEQRENELLNQQYAQRAEEQRQAELGDMAKTVLGVTSPKGGSSFRDMADFYYSQGMIDKDKYTSLQNTDLYSQDSMLPPSVMGKALQPYLNTQTHGYRLGEIGYGKSVPQEQTIEQTQKTIAETKKIAAEAKKAQEEAMYGKKLTPDAVKPIAANKSSIKQIDDAINSLKNYPKAVGLKNIVGEGVSSRLDPKGVEARAKLSNIGSLIIHDRSGAAVTAKEFPRLTPFIPSANDTYETAKKKLEGLKSNIINENTATLDTLQSAGYDTRNYRSRAVSKSGRPIIKINGAWKYEK